MRTNTAHLEGKITFINGDLTDQNSLVRCLKESDPDEVYNLGAMSFVGESWNWTGWRHDGNLSEGTVFCKERDSIGVGLIGRMVLSNDGKWSDFRAIPGP